MNIQVGECARPECIKVLYSIGEGGRLSTHAVLYCTCGCPLVPTRTLASHTTLTTLTNLDLDLASVWVASIHPFPESPSIPALVSGSLATTNRYYRLAIWRHQKCPTFSQAMLVHFLTSISPRSSLPTSILCNRPPDNSSSSDVYLHSTTCWAGIAIDILNHLFLPLRSVFQANIIHSQATGCVGLISSCHKLLSHCFGARRQSSYSSPLTRDWRSVLEAYYYNSAYKSLVLLLAE